uniref:Uncharacterized protein n=1 Tax=Leersia perrieri TaxID=77586 RepID=A0A0D9XSP5_9ORYZ
MKFLMPPLPRAPPTPDLSYITDRTDLSVDQKIEMIIMNHNTTPLPFDEETIIRYFKKYLAQRWKEDEEEGIVLDEDDEEDVLEELRLDEEQGVNKVVLGDEKDPEGTVKRPPQEEAPLEGEPVCKMPRAASPPQGEHNSKSPMV